MAVTYYLYCEETGHGVAVGQDSMGVPSDQCEPGSVVSLFCLAHRNKSLHVLAEPDMVGNWEADVAAELFIGNREMTTDRKSEPVWLTPEQLDDHIKAFGRHGHDVGSGAVKGKTEAHEAGFVKTLMAESFAEHGKIDDIRLGLSELESQEFEILKLAVQTIIAIGRERGKELELAFPEYADANPANHNWNSD